VQPSEIGQLTVRRFAYLCDCIDDEVARTKT
jgi:hypothetical protein